MTELFGRRASLIVDGLLLEGLRIAFRVHKDDGSEPNTAEISVTNLAKTTRANMQSKGAKILLQAGYLENQAIIFSGDARLISHARSGPDWITKIECGDGEQAYVNARLSESFRPGTPKKDVVLQAARATGLDLAQARTQINTIAGSFSKGYSAHGRARDEISRLLDSAGYTWSVQDGRLQILPVGGVTTEQAVVLSPSTGLVGSPEHGAPAKKGKPGVVKLRSLLQPRLKPGGRVSVDSETVKGLLRVLEVNHSGDTAGPDWYSDLEAVPT